MKSHSRGFGAGLNVTSRQDSGPRRTTFRRPIKAFNPTRLAKFQYI